MVYQGNDNTQQEIGISKVLIKMELRLTTKVGDILHVSWLYKKFLSMIKSTYKGVVIIKGAKDCVDCHKNLNPYEFKEWLHEL